MRQATTDINGAGEHILKDFWYSHVNRNVSEKWTVTTRLELPRRRSPKGCKWNEQRETHESSKDHKAGLTLAWSLCAKLCEKQQREEIAN